MQTPECNYNAWGVIPARERWIRSDATSRRSPGKERAGTNAARPDLARTLLPRTSSHLTRGASVHSGRAFTRRTQRRVGAAASAAAKAVWAPAGGTVHRRWRAASSC
eukprot:2365508-Prymnesium_polylepis.1